MLTNARLFLELRLFPVYSTIFIRLDELRCDVKFEKFEHRSPKGDFHFAAFAENLYHKSLWAHFNRKLQSKRDSDPVCKTQDTTAPVRLTSDWRRAGGEKSTQNLLRKCAIAKNGEFFCYHFSYRNHRFCCFFWSTAESFKKDRIKIYRAV